MLKALVIMLISSNFRQLESRAAKNLELKFDTPASFFIAFEK